MTLCVDRSDFYVYLYKYPNGVPFYAGLGTGKRLKKHLYAARTGGKDCNPYKQNIIKKILAQGQEPVVEKIIANIDREFAALVEQEVIAKYGRRSDGGLLVNMTGGGDGTYGLSEEAEFRRRESLRAVECSTRFKKGVPSINKGIPMSKEVKAKCGLVNLGKKYCLGFKHTAETRANMSAAHKGQLPWIAGKKHSAESIEKMRVSHRGKTLKVKRRPLTEEQRAKMKKLNPWLCPHCQTAGYNIGAGNRWHFDNCKDKGKITC
jgi:NUMOD3 motif